MRITTNMNEKMENRFRENLLLLIVIILISLVSVYIAN